MTFYQGTVVGVFMGVAVSLFSFDNGDPLLDFFLSKQFLEMIGYTLFLCAIFVAMFWSVHGRHNNTSVIKEDDEEGEEPEDIDKSDEEVDELTNTP